MYPELSPYNPTYLEYTRKALQAMYDQQVTEDEDVYLTRIFMQRADESDDEFLSRISILRVLYPDLDVWNNPDYLKYSSKYYARMYSKYADETVMDYYKRLFVSYEDESDEDYVTRIALIQTLFPELDVWQNVSYLTITSRYYKALYSRTFGQTDEEYYTALFEQYEDESDEDYLTRMSFVREVYPELDVWNSVRYVGITRHYYSLLYAKKPGETLKAYSVRLQKKYLSETEQQHKSRMALLKQVFPNPNIWNPAYQKTQKVRRALSVKAAEMVSMSRF